jgi:hypothetical protein
MRDVGCDHKKIGANRELEILCVVSGKGCWLAPAFSQDSMKSILHDQGKNNCRNQIRISRNAIRNVKVFLYLFAEISRLYQETRNLRGVWLRKSRTVCR